MLAKEMSDENQITKRDEIMAEHLMDRDPHARISESDGKLSLDQGEWAWEGGHWCRSTGPSHWNHIGGP